MTEYFLEASKIEGYEQGDEAEQPTKYVVNFISYSKLGEPKEMGILTDAELAPSMKAFDPDTKKLFQRMLDRMKTLNSES